MTSRPEALDDFAIFSPFWFTLPEIVARTGHFFIIFNTQKAVISFGFTVERQMSFIMWNFTIHSFIDIVKLYIRIFFPLLSLKSLYGRSKKLILQRLRINCLEWGSFIIIRPWRRRRVFVVFQLSNLCYILHLTPVHQRIKKCSHSIRLEDRRLLMIFLSFSWELDVIFSWTYIHLFLFFEPFYFIFGPHSTSRIDMFMGKRFVWPRSRRLFLNLSLFPMHERQQSSCLFRYRWDNCELIRLLLLGKFASWFFQGDRLLGILIYGLRVAYIMWVLERFQYFNWIFWTLTEKMLTPKNWLWISHCWGRGMRIRWADRAISQHCTVQVLD
jgi:hypothetical protein